MQGGLVLPFEVPRSIESRYAAAPKDPMRPHPHLTSSEVGLSSRSER